MRALLKVNRTALLVLFLLCLSALSAQAQQQAVRPIRVLVLYWDEKDYPANVDFERHFQAAMRLASPGPIEFYAEFLESSRFPGESQSKLLHDYIRQKYAGRTIDVIVPNADAPLDFLFKYRNDFFPHTPIVFSATHYPTAAELRLGAGATGIVFVSSYRKTIDLALKLRPGTEHIFIVSGTPAHDKLYQTMAESQLKGYENKAAITYLTDLPLQELMARIKNLPAQSIILYVWQQVRDEEGKILESPDVLKLIAPLARVPLYGMSFVNVGRGIVGGYVWTMEANTTRLAEMTLQVASGTRPSNIPVENAPDTPMFDWHQLQRWGISEDRLPENSVIRFREVSLWQQFKWRIIAVIAIVALQSLLIGALLFERRRSRRNAAALIKAQQVLRESEERFRNIADSAPAIVWVCHPDGAVSFINRFGLSFFGRTIEQIQGIGWTNLLHPDDSARVALEISSATAGCHMYQISFRIRRADGEYRWVLANGAPRFVGDVYVGHIGIATDITELKQSQEQLQAAQKLESLGVLAGGIAHDFNNLLGGIHSEAELVEMDLAIGSAAREEIQRIKTAAIRGSEIVRELMVYAGETQKDINEAVDVLRLVEEMLKLLKVSISKQVLLRTDFREDLPTVWGNAPQIRQVLMNLVLNASEAIGDAKGVITVTATRVSGGRDLAKSNATGLPAGDYVRIEVSDTGCGMTEETKAKILAITYLTFHAFSCILSLWKRQPPSETRSSTLRTSSIAAST
jgi:PAS domain S-box-containing protein